MTVDTATELCAGTVKVPVCGGKGKKFSAVRKPLEKQYNAAISTLFTPT
jgi:hypothetical protein